MKYRGLLMALLLAWLPAYAISSFESGGKTLRVNDSQTELIDALGQPTHKVSLDDSRGDHLGDYYYYTVEGKTIRFLIHDERITEIFEMR